MRYLHEYLSNLAKNNQIVQKNIHIYIIELTIFMQEHPEKECRYYGAYATKVCETHVCKQLVCRRCCLALPMVRHVIIFSLLL